MEMSPVKFYTIKKEVFLLQGFTKAFLLRYILSFPTLSNEVEKCLLIRFVSSSVCPLASIRKYCYKIIKDVIENENPNFLAVNGMYKSYDSFTTA